MDKFIAWLFSLIFAFAAFAAKVYVFIFTAAVYVIYMCVTIITPHIRERKRSRSAPHRPPALSAAKKSASKPQKNPIDDQLIYEAADAALAYADALKSKALKEQDPVKRTRWLSQAQAQRLRAETIARKASTF